MFPKRFAAASILVPDRLSLASRIESLQNRSKESITRRNGFFLPLLAHVAIPREWYPESNMLIEYAYFTPLSRNPLPDVRAATEHFNDHFTKLERVNYWYG